MGHNRIHKTSAHSHTSRPFFSKRSHRGESEPFFSKSGSSQSNTIQLQQEEDTQPDLEEIQTKPVETDRETLQQGADEPLPLVESPPEEPPTIQTKLTIGQPNDLYEQEADHISEQVVKHFTTPPQKRQTAIQAYKISQVKNQLSTKSSNQLIKATNDVSLSHLKSSIASSKGQGQSLGNTVRPVMEHAFGADFSEVRIHTGAQSNQLNKMLQSKAFTAGKDIYFRDGAYASNSSDGQRLLAHELTHVIQQSQESPLTQIVQRQATSEKLRAKVLSAAEVWSQQGSKRQQSLKRSGQSRKETYIYSVPDPEKAKKRLLKADVTEVEIEVTVIERQPIGGWCKVRDPDNPNQEGYILSALLKFSDEAKAKQPLTQGPSTSPKIPSPTTTQANPQVVATFSTGQRLTITGDTSIGSGSYAIAVNRDDGKTIYGELIDASGTPTGDAIEAKKSDLISATPFATADRSSAQAPSSPSPQSLAKEYSVTGIPNVDPKIASEYLKWQQLKKIGRVFATGAKLYPIASKKSTPLATLNQKELIFIERVSGNGWLYVTTARGISGYLIDIGFHQQAPKTVFVNNISPADPTADIYKVKPGDTALGIAQEHYSSFVKPGHDARYFIGVIAWANGRGSDKNKGIYHKDGKDVSNWETNWFSTSSWEKCSVVAERWIWIPSANLAKQLENTITDGSLTNGLWSKVKDVAEVVAGGAAFIGGIVAGAIKSIWDLVTGLVDLGKILVKTIRSLITGSIVSDIKELIGTLSKVDFGDLIIKGFENLKKKWNGGTLVEKWYFRGKVVGYILAEILMLFFSGGAAAAKWAGKFGKLGSVLKKSAAIARFANKTQKIVDKGGDAVRYAQKALKSKRADAISDAGKLSDEAADVGKLAKSGAKLEGKTIAEKSVKLAKGEHKIHIQEIGNKVQIWICSDCGRMLNKIDDMLNQISSTGPTKSLHRRLTRLRDKVANAETKVRSKALPREHLHRELNQLGAHLRDLSTKYPDFDELAFFRGFKAKKLEPFATPPKTGIYTVLARSKRGFELVKGNEKLGWIHIKNGHVIGKPGKTMFPKGMSQNDVKNLIIKAVDEGAEATSKQADKIKIIYRPKKFGVSEMEVWVNKSTKVIESAYPKKGTGVWTFAY